MPHLTGEDLVREVHRIRPDVSIMLCTGFSPTMTAEHTAILGIDALARNPSRSATSACHQQGGTTERQRTYKKQRVIRLGKLSRVRNTNLEERERRYAGVLTKPLVFDGL